MFFFTANICSGKLRDTLSHAVKDMVNRYIFHVDANTAHLSWEAVFLKFQISHPRKERLRA
jgi:hypothetical protein